MKELYTAVATAKGGRKGFVETSNGSLKLKLTMPKGLGGDGKPGNNPEELFASGYSACFGSAIDYVASQQKKQLKDIEVTAHVSIGLNDQNKLGLKVQLDVRLPGVPRQEAEALVAEAHKICPYSVATRGNIDVQLKVLEAEQKAATPTLH